MQLVSVETLDFIPQYSARLARPGLNRGLIKCVRLYIACVGFAGALSCGALAQDRGTLSRAENATRPGGTRAFEPRASETTNRPAVKNRALQEGAQTAPADVGSRFGESEDTSSGSSPSRRQGGGLDVAATPARKHRPEADCRRALTNVDRFRPGKQPLATRCDSR